MKKDSQNTTLEILKKMKQLKSAIDSSNADKHQNQINKDSPYSNDINNYILTYDEFYFYHSLKLKEALVTRKALVREIDVDLWVSSRSCTNRELLILGEAPYAYDSEDGRIELHHIGQCFDAPFVELTAKEHNQQGHNKTLHPSDKSSWRNIGTLEKDFNSERRLYWMKRGKDEISIYNSDADFLLLEKAQFTAKEELNEGIRETIEVLFQESSVEDLHYFSDLAQSYALAKQVGANTISEFIYKLKADQHNSERISCSYCGSQEYSLYGCYSTSSEKVQRYKCKNCNKVFTSVTESLISGCSFSFPEWLKFIDCLYNGYSVKQTAKSCNVSEKTVHNNRIKLFYALKLLDNKIKLAGNIVIDETYIPVSYKGNHSKRDDFVMPRQAFRRGGENHKRGISDNLICIVCALDDSGNSVAHVIGPGTSSSKKIGYALYDSLDKDNVFCFYSDKATAIKKFANDNKFPIKQAKLIYKANNKVEQVELNSDVFEVNRYIQSINAYHSRLKRFLNKFSGISSRYLSGYLYLFAWKDRNKNRDQVEAYKELFEILTEPKSFVPIENIIKYNYLPDATNLTYDLNFYKLKNDERARAIYARHASGETLKSIAKDYNVTLQAISKTIINYRKHGLAYKTQRDLKKEEQLYTNKIRYRDDILRRNWSIYHKKLSWKGSAKDFEQAMMSEYRISRQTVKNIVAQMQRVEELQKEFYIFEDIQYRSLEEIYKSVYNDFLILHIGEKLSKNKSSEILAERYSFTKQNILRIVKVMSSDNEHYFEGKKGSTIETTNRDKALFIDFLRWDGSKTDFYKWSSTKYGISEQYISWIIKLCCIADPRRYDMA